MPFGQTFTHDWVTLSLNDLGLLLHYVRQSLKEFYLKVIYIGGNQGH